MRGGRRHAEDPRGPQEPSRLRDHPALALSGRMLIPAHPGAAERLSSFTQYLGQMKVQSLDVCHRSSRVHACDLNSEPISAGSERRW